MDEIETLLTVVQVMKTHIHTRPCHAMPDCITCPFSLTHNEIMETLNGWMEGVRQSDIERGEMTQRL